MSLSIHDSRSRGKSPGRGSRDRSRSRDIRAPSPPHKSSRETVKKSTKKHYDSESDSDSRQKKPSKRYSDSDSDDRYKKSSRRHKDESDSDSKYGKRSTRAYREGDSDRRHKELSKRSHRRDNERSESSSSSSSESESDHRFSKQSKSKSKHKSTEPKHRRGSSPDSHALTKRGEYMQSSKPQYDREPAPGRHPSYAFEQSRPTEYTRHLSSTGSEVPFSMPGQYNWNQDQPLDAHSQSRHPSFSQEQQRQLSISGGFNASIGGHPQHGQYPSSQLPAQYPYGQPGQPRPEAHRIHSASSTGSGQYQYAEPSQNINYLPKNDGRRPSYTQSAHPQFVDAKPHSSGLYADPSAAVGSRMHRLSVSGGAAGAAGALTLAAPGQHSNHDMHGGLPPGSPLLEAYHGTYQSISPMPSPLMLPSTMDDGLSDLEPLSPGYSSSDSRYKSSSHHARKMSTSKRVSFYDPEPDALALAAALKHSTPAAAPIIKVLPQLSDDHVLELRTEYKKHIKVNGKGINIAKHIKLKVSGNLGKAAYAVALGRWESEAHWANFWYQSNSSRRELLIESLMGRTNSEIVKIKDAFSDKRYNDSLEKCMQTELKKDKFRNAILLALEEKRMSENEKLDVNLVRRDVQELYKALVSKEGGETAMINIIVVRSDNHLREVLRTFEASYRKNFAREMIAKSRNLVGETLAHILNGVLNRPVRDALLLHQAITETSKDRTELIVSRLVRFHWEPKHLEKVKVEYRRKYGSSLEHDVAEGTRGDFGEFMVGLCKGGVK
ncbi:MAG: hypothetical protein L6R37_005287 [Teloschistes peruensis]|nr:MAG: hypothetical protein L6R37_005287 [Teloschistes peruensis]